MLGLCSPLPSWFCSPEKNCWATTSFERQCAPQGKNGDTSCGSVTSRLLFALPNSSTRETTLLCCLPLPNCQSFAFCNKELVLQPDPSPRSALPLTRSHSTSSPPQTERSRHSWACRCYLKSQGQLILTISGCSESQLRQNH